LELVLAATKLLREPKRHPTFHELLQRRGSGTESSRDRLWNLTGYKPMVTVCSQA
jgi:hypothetical protein